MTRKLTGPALVAYLRQFPSSDDRGWAADEIERLLAERDAMADALAVIDAWEPPQVLSRSEMVPMAVAIGSNGERDYFRGIARAALAQGES